MILSANFLYFRFQGLMTKIDLQLPQSEQPVPVVTPLQGQAYNEQNLKGIIDALKLVSTSNVQQAMNGSV